MKRLIIACFVIILLQGCTSASKITSPSMNNWNRITAVSNSPYPTQTIAQSRTLSPTSTWTEWRSPTEKYTPLPTVDLSNVPQDILEAANNAGMTPSEVVYLFNMLKKVARDRDPYPLLDFLQFPLHELDRCPGDILETSEEFIKRFPEIMNETTRANILKLKLEDIFLSYQGMGLGVNSKFDVWFVPYCYDNDCGNHLRIILESFLGYTTYWDMVEGFPAPKPTYDPSLIGYGKYKSTSLYISSGIYTKLDESLMPWNDFILTISNTAIAMGPYPMDLVPSYFHQYESCPYKKMEICSPSDEDYSIGDNSLGRVQFICANSPRVYDFQILSDNRLGLLMGSYSDANYLVLKLANM